MSKRHCLNHFTMVPQHFGENPSMLLKVIPNFKEFFIYVGYVYRYLQY